MADSFLTPKRLLSEGSPESSAKSSRLDAEQPVGPLKAGMWVTMKPSSKRKRDKLKANTPCLVTALHGETAKVMYQNQLTLFMRQYDDSVLIRCRTESCAVVDLRLCKAEDMPALDRQMILALCTVLQDVPQAKSTGSKGLVGDKERFDLFTACVARAFQTAKREVLERKDLEGTLVDTFSADEIAEGLSGLDSLNKIMLQDESVFFI